MFKRVLPAALFFLSAAGAHAAADPAVTLHGKRFSTEFAVTDDQRAMGLMNRKAMDADHSMLFIFPDDQPRTFWMKDTLIPLDIIYFDKDRKLVSMQLNAQPCKADPCPLYGSDGAARYVLELNAGTASRLGLKVGEPLAVEGDVGAVK